MKKTIFLFLLTALAASCDKGPSYAPSSKLDVSFDLEVIDGSGLDLLDPENNSSPNFIKREDVSVEDVSSVENETAVYDLPLNPDEAGPQIILLIPPDKTIDKYRLRFFFNAVYEESKLRITLKDGFEPDTFVGENQRLNGKIVCTSIHMNDGLVWSSASSNNYLRNLRKIIN